jgi:Na+-transporting methylmalonyl-CoA/oxaloacetate decarboxylase gamma subunit
VTVTVPRLVAVWGAANGVLLAVLIGYGENSFAIALYAAVVALLELIALVAWLSMVRNPEAGERSPAGLRSDAALVTAIGVGFVGVGYVYKWWMALPAVYSLLWLVTHGVSALLERHASVEPEPAGASSSPGDGHPAAATVAGAATVATAAIVGGRWWRRRQP